MRRHSDEAGEHYSDRLHETMVHAHE